MRKKSGESHVISASTILILSGFLIGLTVGKIVSESLSPYVLSCGLAGFLAFIALEFTGNQREEEEAHVEQVQLQGRLDRHVMSLSSMSFKLPDTVTSAHPSITSISEHGVSGLDSRKMDELYEQLMKVGDDSDSAIQAPRNSA